MDYDADVDAVAAASIDGRTLTPPPTSLAVKGAALLKDNSVVAVKINGNFPGNPVANGLPTVRGLQAAAAASAIYRHALAAGAGTFLAIA